MKKIFLLAALLCIGALTSFVRTKPVFAEYGRDGYYFRTLRLYKDSTYSWVEWIGKESHHDHGRWTVRGGKNYLNSSKKRKYKLENQVEKIYYFRMKEFEMNEFLFWFKQPMRGEPSDLDTLWRVIDTHANLGH